MLAFDRADLVKLDQLRSDAACFRVRVDIGFATSRFCLLSARIWPTHIISAGMLFESSQTPVAGKL